MPWLSPVASYVCGCVCGSNSRRFFVLMVLPVLPLCGADHIDLRTILMREIWICLDTRLNLVGTTSL